MFYEIKKGGELVERFNPPAAQGKPLTQSEKDKAALARAKELKGDEVLAIEGKAPRQVL